MVLVVLAHTGQQVVVDRGGIAHHLIAVPGQDLVGRVKSVKRAVTCGALIDGVAGVSASASPPNAAVASKNTPVAAVMNHLVGTRSAATRAQRTGRERTGCVTGAVTTSA